MYYLKRKNSQILNIYDPNNSIKNKTLKAD